MNHHEVMIARHYDRIDGYSANQSPMKQLTLGAPLLQDHKRHSIAAQLWKENEQGERELAAELPIHQIMDLMIFLSRTLLHFRDAYRLPLLYDPEHPTLERIGLQGGVLPVEVCTDNPEIEKDIQAFSQALSELGELTGERLRRLMSILEKLECT